MDTADDYDTILWRWTCTYCGLCIRTRTSSTTSREARQHSWTDHRVAPRLIIPTMCMWDPRIKGSNVLFTYESRL